MPPANAAPDAELLRLLDAYGAAREDAPRRYYSRRAEDAVIASRAALLGYLAAAYVRRDRLADDGPWEPGDGSAYAAALEREGADDA